MSVQFGRWDFEGQVPARECIQKASAILAPYGPDSDESYSKGGIAIVYRAFHTTQESRREAQPYVSAFGAVITWDGRLDNRMELVRELGRSLARNSALSNPACLNSRLGFTDVQIVAAAYEEWGCVSFSKLIGDWALSIWSPSERSILLAKDPIGSRQLYYSIEKDHVTWSSLLDPLVVLAGKTFDVCDEYLAGWLATMFPSPHLTPYLGIHSVPPSCFVRLRNGQRHVSRYWDFHCKPLRYRTDREYEQHFRFVFSNAVQRRLRCDRPVLAELSGGVDSSSIVCIADNIIARGAADTPRLDTITWYDDAFPNWGERPYFTLIEERRGRTGWHIDLTRRRDSSSQKPFRLDTEGNRLPAIPIPDNDSADLFKEHAAYMSSQGQRVTLSGIGGGEVTSDGAPSPSLELQDLLARARLLRLVRQLDAWSVKMGERRTALLWEAIRAFLPSALTVRTRPKGTTPWLHASFASRYRGVLTDRRGRVKLFGALPSFQNNLEKMDANRRFLAECGLRSDLRGEVRYPYFDREFLEFMYAIPREQIVRVGQRRSLMRRALMGIVPTEILNRKRAAPSSQVSQQDRPNLWANLTDLEQGTMGSLLGMFDSDRLHEALQSARRSEGLSMSLKRTLCVEAWLRHLSSLGLRANRSGDNCPS